MRAQWLTTTLSLLLFGCGAAPHASSASRSEQPTWTFLASGTTESLRGLSLVSRDVAWASGRHGAVLRTIDGATWTRCASPPNADELDFRSLHALDADRAIVLSAGSPARMFATSDGCASWTETFAREGDGVFFDSLFLRGDRDGIALGDPLPTSDGARFALLVTHDAGRSWEARVGPLAATGEAAFAASNGCIAWPSADLVLFATGGSASRVFRSTDGGASWVSASVPVASSPSAGIFAITFRDASRGYAVGGDYSAPSAPGSFARTVDGGASWQVGASPRGYRSSIAIVDAGLVAVGTSGSDLSRDEGARWTAIDDVPLNTVRAIDGLTYAVGPEGTIARLSLR